MTSNYFSIECNGQCYVPMYLVGDNGEIAFTDLMNMSYDEMKSYDGIDEFIVCVMDAADELVGGYAQTEVTVTLIDKSGTFVWSIIIGYGDAEDEFKYVFVDWRKDGNTFRYMEE